MSQNYPSLIEALPANLREPVLDAISSLQLKIAEHIVSGVLQSEETLESIQRFCRAPRRRSFIAKSFRRRLTRKISAKSSIFSKPRVRSVVKEPVFEQKISDFINRQIDGLMTTNTPLGEMFTDDAVELLKEKASEQIEPIVHQLAELATAERTRNQISSLIKREVHNYYENLPFFKKIFVSRENLLKEVDDLVNESLPKRIEETLRGDFFATEAKNFLDKAIDNAMSRPIPEIIGKIAPEQLERLKSQIIKGVLSVLQGEEMQNSISAYLTDTLHKIRPHSIDAILQTIHPESEEKLKNMLSKGLIEYFKPRRNREYHQFGFVAPNRATAFRANRQACPTTFPKSKFAQAGKSLTETIIAAAREKLPESDYRNSTSATSSAKKSIIIRSKSSKRLVLSVAKEHLRKIELFGALFGLDYRRRAGFSLLLGVCEINFELFSKEASFSKQNTSFINHFPGESYEKSQNYRFHSYYYRRAGDLAKIFAFSLGFNLPSINLFSKIKGSGNIKTEKRDVPDFSNVKAGGAINVEVSAQKEFSVEVEADDNLLEYIKTEVKGETLKIYTEDRISTRNPIRMRISMPNIEVFRRFRRVERQL